MTKYTPDNALRLSAAVKPFGQIDPYGTWQNNGRDAYLNTYLYVGCNYDWGYSQITCNSKEYIQMAKSEGWFFNWVLVLNLIKYACN